MHGLTVGAGKAFRDMHKSGMGQGVEGGHAAPFLIIPYRSKRAVRTISDTLICFALASLVRANFKECGTGRERLGFFVMMSYPPWMTFVYECIPPVNRKNAVQ